MKSESCYLGAVIRTVDASTMNSNRGEQRRLLKNYYELYNQ